jgi:glyoxylase-like metal-dependent hydrolase (beta-lactamase superfamily II)
MCPLGGKYMDGFSHGLSSHLVCHCLILETNEGLVLVDTGFGTQDLQNPQERLGHFFLHMNRIQLDPEKTALRKIEKLGFKASDVRHIIVTHLDFDHAGGISDFPHAQVHVLKAELESAQTPKSWLERHRYSPFQLADSKQWNTYSADGETWFGFSSVRDLKGLPPEILMVPLIGHTWGHCGVAVQSENGWLLHAGDAYFYRGEMAPQYHCTPGLRMYQKMMEVDRESRLMNQRRLRQLIRNHSAEVKIFSAHDAVELEAFRRAEKNPTRLLRSPALETGFELH